jgi:very-short-patch-repair endonuclease
LKQPKPMNLVKELRCGQTDAEGKIWANLRAKRLSGIKFRRQQPIGNYIVDFVSFEQKLIIEVDGGQHNEAPNIEKDEKRTKYLESKGYRVIRFWDNDVLENIEGVMFKINEIIENVAQS